MASLKERLTQILVDNKLVTKAQLDKAIAAQKEKGGGLCDIIVGLGFAKEEQLISALSQGLGLPLIDLKRFNIDRQILQLIPVDISRHYQIIPVSKMGNTVTLAMADPLNIFAIDDVKALTGYKINPIISSAGDISQAIELAYPDSTKGIVDDLVKEMSIPSIELVRQETEAQLSYQELTRISQEAPVIQVTNILLEEGVKKKSSDILIEPFDKELRVRFRIDGILQEQKAPPKAMHQSIVSRIKVMSDLNIAEHRLPQDGRFKIRLLRKEVDFRVSVLPSSFGEKVALRILDKSYILLDIEKLGFSKESILKLKQAVSLPHGMVLVCGPTGSGKTTTLYSLLKFIDSPEKNIVTVEDPVEFQLEGINQVTVNPEIGLSFAVSLRSILRQDPNIIMIGEIRDYETLDIAIKSALTGHLLLSTLHTTTSAGAIARLVNMGVEPYLINSSLLCVVAQRLVRRLCPICREKYTIGQEIINSLKASTDFLGSGANNKLEFFRGKGCGNCFNTGYSGRTGITEILLLSEKIRQLILSRAQEHIIKQQARKEGMRTLREDGLKAASQGLTSLEEVLRVSAPDE